MRLVGLASLILVIAANVYAQEILWAERVESQINTYSETGKWSAEMALGFPDALPQGELSEKAVRLESQSSFGSISLGFDHPIKVNFIIISENFDPGRITDIALIDSLGNRVPVYNAEADPYFDNFRMWVLNTSGTSIVSDQIEISLNTAGDPGWSQIDAVAISNYSQSDQILQVLSSDIFFNVREEIAFVDRKEKLDRTINTKYDEVKPLISPDGSTLYFSRANHPANAGGKKDAQDILYSKSLENGFWSAPEAMVSPLNNKYSNGVISVTPDGNLLYLIDNYHEEQRYHGGIARSFNTDKGWTYPSKIDITNYRNTSEYEDFFITNDGKVMLLSMQNNESFGSLDLYISFFDPLNNNWSEPINLGPSINTTGAEYAPFLASDDKTLYFSSNGHPGYGKSDIFFTYRLDESWLNWIKPQNLGKNINTAQMDGYYTVPAKGDYGYFVSTDDGYAGSRDIFRVKLSGSAKPEPVILVKGIVFDKETGIPLNSEINYQSQNDSGTGVSSPITGSFTLILNPGTNYSVKALKPNYIGEEILIDLTARKDFEELEITLDLIPIKPGSVITLRSILFERGKADLKEESFRELIRWTNILNENPSIIIELGGHTDNQGSYNANVKLSEERVLTVKDYFVEQGIHSSRIKTKGYGPSKPLNNNATEEKRAQNRRVEITILQH